VSFDKVEDSRGAAEVLAAPVQKLREDDFVSLGVDGNVAVFRDEEAGSGVEFLEDRPGKVGLLQSGS